jgi:hypothetical protein
VRFAFAPLLEEGAPLLDEPVDAASLVEKLDPRAAAMFVSGSEVRALVTQESFVERFSEQGTPEDRERWIALHDALGSGMAAALVVHPPRENGEDSSAALAPVLGLEAVLGVSDPDGAREALQSAMRARDLPEDGPWVFPSTNGEIGIALQDRKLLIATGPAGALQALSARRSSAPRAPSRAAAQAMSVRLGGGWVDVDKLRPGLDAGEELQTSSEALQSWRVFLAVTSRFRTFTFTGERFGSAVRVEVIGELAPEPEHSEWQD